MLVLSAVEVSIGKLIEAVRKNEVNRLREELVKAGKVSIALYKLPRFKLKARAPGKRLVELDPGMLSRLEYALFKATIEAAKNGKLPTFKDVADIASDYKATARYLITLAEMGYVVFLDPAKAAKLEEAIKATSESKYRRSVSKALDLAVALNTKALEERVVKVSCDFENGKFVCNLYSHGEDREQEKLQVEILNEYI